MKLGRLTAALLMAAAGTGIFAASLPVEQSKEYANQTPSLRVQVYNTCFTSLCDSPQSYYKTHSKMFGSLFFLPGQANNTFPIEPDEVREASANLSDVLDMVDKHQPDIAILPEILKGINSKRLEDGLRDQGFEAFSYGCMDTFEPPFEICTLIASREPGDFEEIQLYHSKEKVVGGAAVLARFEGTSVMGVHLANAYNPDVRSQQLYDIAQVVEIERSMGRNVIVAGDFNEHFENLQEHAAFGPLGFSSASIQTYPSWRFSGFSRLDIDHILYSPEEYDSVRAYTSRGTSDHLSLVMDLAEK